jgi:hypothetical protein
MPVGNDHSPVGLHDDNDVSRAMPDVLFNGVGTHGLLPDP